MGGLSHDQISLGIRVVLGVDMYAICLLTVWFYFQNEGLAARAEKYGPITYHAFGSIVTGIAYGHPSCPPEIANECKRLRRKLTIYSLYLWVLPGIYMIFLRENYH